MTINAEQRPVIMKKFWCFDYDEEIFKKLDINKQMPKNCFMVPDPMLCAAIDEISALRLRIQDLENNR